MATEPIAVGRLSRDIVNAAKLLSKQEIRYLVDTYYAMQGYRIRCANQTRALVKSEEPCEVVPWLVEQNQILENQIKRVLDKWTANDPVSIWARSIVGVGPVIAAGLAAHIDITKAPTAGHIWSFAGIDGRGKKWAEHEKRPWNAPFRSLVAFKLGESFVKVSNHDEDVYGHLYAKRKLLEQERNQAGNFREDAARILKEKKFGKDTDAYAWYTKGLLPPAHIHARARRYAVKIFLSHYHHVAYKLILGQDPPKPFVIEHLGHVHMIRIPNFPINDGNRINAGE